MMVYKFCVRVCVIIVGVVPDSVMVMVWLNVSSHVVCTRALTISFLCTGKLSNMKVNTFVVVRLIKSMTF